MSRRRPSYWSSAPPSYYSPSSWSTQPAALLEICVSICTVFATNSLVLITHVHVFSMISLFVQFICTVFVGKSIDYSVGKNVAVVICVVKLHSLLGDC